MQEKSPILATASLTLDLPPSCLQFYPSDATYLVVGTYNLRRDGPEEVPSGKPQTRNGSLLAFRLDDDHIEKVQIISQPSALLDLRFHPRQGEHRGILAVVSSTGTLAIFKLDPYRSDRAPLQHLATSRCEGLSIDILFLQCAWHPVLAHVIAVTTSTGLARLLHLDHEWKIRSSTELDVGNSLEAWSIALYPMTNAEDGGGHLATVYCGGDDSFLRYALCSWDADNASSEPNVVYPSVAVGGQHDAGITAILPLPVYAMGGCRLVVTGSYDDRLRVFAINDYDKLGGMKRLRLMCDSNLGGGVWRLDLVDVKLRGDASWQIRILASCMHAGVRLVVITSESDGLNWACKVEARFEQHKSMNYATHFVAMEDSRRLRCVSTSFYDKLLCLWDYHE
ncbi:hypothetical protein CDD83_5482 [Cordyceps sp. RAO-2017]|nr:hypothetical protein CDD83_5482 [Cordyceps sp. RAO-2017]